MECSCSLDDSLFSSFFSNFGGMRDRAERSLLLPSLSFELE